jgi:ABC-type multidrug transport system fused ATPase/permease subunit
MIVVMLVLRWDFALIALAVAPLLIVFLIRVNKAIKTAVTEVRTRQSDLLSTLQEGLQSIEVVQAYSREDYEDRQVQKVSKDTVTAWLRTRRLSAMLSPVVSLVIAACTGLVLWRGALLILAGTMTAGALTVFLAYLARFFQPVRALSQMTNTLAQVSVGFQWVTAVCDADTVIAERAAPIEPPPLRGEITFENVSFGYDPQMPVLGGSRSTESTSPTTPSTVCAPRSASCCRTPSCYGARSGTTSPSVGPTPPPQHAARRAQDHRDQGRLGGRRRDSSGTVGIGRCLRRVTPPSVRPVPLNQNRAPLLPNGFQNAR